VAYASIFELENTQEGCDFLLLLKLLVRIADFFVNQPFHKTIYVKGSLVYQSTFRHTKGRCNCESCCQHAYHYEEGLGFGQPNDKQQFIFTLSTGEEQLQNFTMHLEMLMF